MSTELPSLNAALAQVIRGEIAARGMRASELADKMGHPRSSVSRRLRNITPIDTNKLADFADALGLRPEDLTREARILRETGIVYEVVDSEDDVDEQPFGDGRPLAQAARRGSPDQPEGEQDWEPR